MSAMHQQQSTRLTKKQKRVLRQEGVLEAKTTKLNPAKFSVKKDIEPITESQRIAFEAWDDGMNLMLHGIAGTGKTFLGLHFALSEVTSSHSQYRKVYIVRSVVPTRDMGFLPGNKTEKTKVFEGPYYDIASKIFGRGDAYDILKQKQLVEFMSTSYIRGITIDDAIIVVDEMQNMNAMELHSIMTRVGVNCRIIFCGDLKQDDLTSERKKETSGLGDFMRIIAKMKEFEFVEFFVDDIVRSDLVKSYIIERDKLGL